MTAYNVRDIERHKESQREGGGDEKGITLLQGPAVQGLDYSGMGECKRPLSRDRKTFPAWWNVKKVSCQGPEDFSGMGKC
jgi:hypothetical protein